MSSRAFNGIGILIVIVMSACLFVKEIINIKRQNTNTSFKIVLYDYHNYFVFQKKDKNNTYYLPHFAISKKRFRINTHDISKNVLKELFIEKEITIDEIKKNIYSVESITNKRTNEQEYVVVLYYDSNLNKALKKMPIMYNEHIIKNDSNCAFIIRQREKQVTQHLINSYGLFSAVLSFITIVGTVHTLVSKTELVSSSIDLLSFFISLLLFLSNTLYGFYCYKKLENRKIFVDNILNVISISFPFFGCAIISSIINIENCEISYLSLFAILISVLNYLPELIYKKLRLK